MENTEIKYLIGIATGFCLLLGIFLFTFFMIFRRNQNKRQKQIDHLNEEMLKTQLEIQEQTLKNISQEIHDNVGQVLSLAKLNLNTMDITKTEQLKGKIDNTLTQVSKAINDLRDLSKSFNTDNITAIGLIRAMEYELDMIKKTGSHKAIFEISGSIKKFGPQKELILFRIIQEILHNIIKHAEAGTIHISAIYTDKELELEITDDGNGFDLTTLNTEGSNGSGLGIRNMHNRAKIIGANFAIRTNPFEGTTVKLVLPFEGNLAQSKTEVK